MKKEGKKERLEKLLDFLGLKDIFINSGIWENEKDYKKFEDAVFRNVQKLPNEPYQRDRHIYQRIDRFMDYYGIHCEPRSFMAIALREGLKSEGGISSQVGFIAYQLSRQKRRIFTDCL